MPPLHFFYLNTPAPCEVKAVLTLQIDLGGEVEDGD